MDLFGNTVCYCYSYEGKMELKRDPLMWAWPAIKGVREALINVYGSKFERFASKYQQKIPLVVDHTKF